MSSAFLSFLMFSYLWLCWIFAAVCRLSLAVSGVTLVAVLGFLIVVASFVAVSSVVVAHGLSCPVARGILPDQGSNPCPLNWQADS